MRARARAMRESLWESLGAAYQSRPAFLIVGVEKGGTTALHAMLLRHRRIAGASTKEIHFFDNDQWYGRHDAILQYHSHFPRPHRVPWGTLLFEATPAYFYHCDAATRIHRYDPRIKIIVVLRDPVERALSAWKMYHHQFRSGYFPQWHDQRSFAEAIELELQEIEHCNVRNNRIAYVKKGVYVEHLSRYLSLFPANQILILESTALRHHWPETRAQICAFLGIADQPIAAISRNQSPGDVAPEHADTLARLRDFYRPHNAALAELLGRRFDWSA